MTINLGTPKPTELKPKISVIGIGGAGGNAVNNMISANLEGVEFIATNTDAQALSHSLSERTVQLGASLTQGLGSGSKPEVGRAAAMEAQDEIMDHIQGSHMAFVTAGMGGGTGTGAAPVIAQLAREAGVLTVGVVTKPFQFEGAHRMAIAEAGILELQSYVDTLIVIPNQNLFRVANERTTFADAFKMADDVLHAGVRGVTDLMVMPGLINLDFADVKAVMEEMGKAMMGTGEAEGDKRALEAAEAAISNPLLEDTSMKGACGILINITGGPDMTLFEVDEAVNRIKEEVDDNANIIFGSTFDERVEGRMRVSIVATGIDVTADSVRPPRLQVVSAVAEEAPAGPIPRESRLAPSFEPARAAEPRFPLPGIAAERAPEQPRAFAEPAAAGASAPVRQPEARSEAVTTTALRSMTSAQPEPEEAFIVPPPVEARAPLRPSSAPDPFAEAAVTNGGAPRRGGPSLLERMTGLGRRKEEAQVPPPPPPPPLPEQATPAAERPLPEATALAAEPAAVAERPLPEATALAAEPATPAAGLPAEPVPEPEPTPSPARLNVDAADRVGAPAEHELLEIPAFLRRQAN